MKQMQSSTEGQVQELSMDTLGAVAGGSFAEEMAMAGPGFTGSSTPPPDTSGSSGGRTVITVANGSRG